MPSIHLSLEQPLWDALDKLRKEDPKTPGKKEIIQTTVKRILYEKTKVKTPTSAYFAMTKTRK